jgi:hypothetical protein
LSGMAADVSAPASSQSETNTSPEQGGGGSQTSGSPNRGEGGGDAKSQTSVDDFGMAAAVALWLIR